MTHRVAWLFSALVCLLAWTAPTEACIAIPIGDGLQPRTMSLDEQRAFLYHEGGREHLVLSVQYGGAPAEFAWVIPVEARPQVKAQGGAPFTELRKVTRLREKEPSRELSVSAAPGGAPPSVTVLERKIEGPYDIAVLHATSGGGLYEWLKANGFSLSRNARGALESYVARGYYFAAARIRPGEKGRETLERRLREGTIAPLHLTFRATELAYPLRVTAGNPGHSKMEIYVVTESPLPVNPALSKSTFRLVPHGEKGFRVEGNPDALMSEGEFPTLRQLLPRGGNLTKYTGSLSDAQRQEDLVFARL